MKQQINFFIDHYWTTHPNSVVQNWDGSFNKAAVKNLVKESN